MIDLVLIQFALSAVAFLLRFSEDCCASWAFRCRACLSCCCRCAAPPRKGQREERLLCRVLSWLMPRWYWVYLSGQAGLLLREAFVINTMVLDPHRPETGWCWEVIVSNAASWIVLLANWAEVRRFALVRNMDVPHKPIDQVMDMLLLPSNYCFFCNLIVRLIRLQSGSRFSHEDTQSLAHTVIASAELWEAWALWSVLELFVTVVNSNVRRTVTVERSHDAHYLDTISGYQRLSIQGVQVWVLMLSGAITSEVVVKGVVALYMPTLCHQGLSIFEGTGCESCAEWYDKNIGTASMCVIYLLCSFAIAFVMYFEDAFKTYLHDIQPFWKFLGVKSVVSITFFQWLVLTYALGFEEEEAMMMHALLICAEMPVLSLVHFYFAYPYGKDWLWELLRDDERPPDPAEAGAVPRVSQELRSFEPGGDAVADEPGGPLELGAGAADAAGGARSSTAGAGDLDEPAQQRRRSSLAADPPRARAAAQPGASWQAVPRAWPRNSWCQMVWDLCLFAGGSCAGAALLMEVHPPARDWDAVRPLHVWHCDSQDLENFLDTGSSEFHWNASDEAWRAVSEESYHQPYEVSQLWWLPLCGQVKVDCALGYTGSVKVGCSAKGQYQRLKGRCSEATCKGETIPAVPNAQQGCWDSEVVSTIVHGKNCTYTCNPGFRGQPVAKCGNDGAWRLSGEECSQVFCAAAPRLEHMTLVKDVTHAAVGARVDYTCEDGYWPETADDTVHAVCEMSGEFVLKGSCKMGCRDDALPAFDNAEKPVPPRRFVDGMEVNYTCGEHYGADLREGGRVYAKCGADGEITRHGRCVEVCRRPSGLELAERHATDAVTYAQVTVGTDLKFECIPGYLGSITATCSSGGVYTWEGRCKILCKAIREVRHAKPLDESLEFGGGKVLDYRCQGGFTGQFRAVCGEQDGEWRFQGPSQNPQCKAVGCKDLSSFLDETLPDSWRDTMEVDETLHVFEESEQDVVTLRCRPGYQGQPFALCIHAEQRWEYRGSCAKISSGSVAGPMAGGVVLGGGAAAAGFAVYRVWLLRQAAAAQARLGPSSARAVPLVPPPPRA